MKRISAWGARSFQLVMVSEAQFVFLTLVAMIFFPGGARFDPQSSGYDFFNNFFSELGFTVTHGGLPNPIAAPLFFIALSGGGLGLILFFLASLQFFWHRPLLRGLSVCGSVAGVVAGLGYIGIALTPANLYPEPHFEFVLLAFRAFLPAVLFYLVVILAHSGYPNRYAGVYLAFAFLLAVYIALITRGPGLDTALGVTIQATGQKLIVYAAIVTIFIQSWGAVKILRADSV